MFVCEREGLLCQLSQARKLFQIAPFLKTILFDFARPIMTIDFRQKHVALIFLYFVYRRLLIKSGPQLGVAHDDITSQLFWSKGRIGPALYLVQFIPIGSTPLDH